MGKSWRQNVIVSHGGRHGSKSQTFRKGQAVTPEASAIIPDSVLGQSTGPAVSDEQPATIMPRGSEPGDHPTLRKLADAAQEERGESVDASALRDAQREPEATPTPLPPPTLPKPKAAAPAAPPAPELSDPLSKRDLQHLKKADIETLAERHDIEVEAGTKSRTQMLRDLLAVKLDL